FALEASDHWYDLQVEVPDTPFRRRLAGHLETGRPSRSDPALGRARIT
ncbi:MAG: phospholipase domain-containing protein, partial [Pseudoxanthomonas sp.]